MSVSTRCLTVLAFAVTVSAAADDLTIVSKVTRDGGPPTTATSYLSSDHARIASADGNEMIADLKTGDITVVDGRKRTYFVITRQDIDRLTARVQQQMDSPEMQRAQAQMKNLPPEVQKRMQAAMGGLAAAVTVQKTGTTRKIAGYNCENWTVAFGEMSKSEECLTGELPLPAQAWQAYQDIASRMRGFTAAMGPMAKGIADLQEKMKDMKGFPLSKTTTTSFMGRSSRTSSEVVEVKKGPIPASAWQVPAGYTKVENPMSKGAPSM